MRVLLVTPRYFPLIGGIETHVHEVAPRLARAGLEVSILTTDRTRTLPKHEVVDGVEIRRVPAWPARRDYYFAPDVYRTIAREPWEVIHCQGCHTLVPPLAMLAARRAHVPYVLTFHTGGHSSRMRTVGRDAQWRLLRPLFAHASRLIGVSRFEADLFQRLLRLPASLFAVVPNGARVLETPASQPANVAAARPAHSRTVLSVGRLERYKGHHRLIAAWPHVLQHRPDTYLRIVGSGPYEAALRSMAESLGVSARVQIGAIAPTDRQGMATAIASAHLVALLSDYEAHPISVMEALAMGRPVLVAGTSGLQEIADKGLARAVPLESSPEDVARAVLRELASRISVRPAIALPTWDECAASLASIYRSAARVAA
jgi:glycosyltransferase involved in cell wall biosynthesis